MDCLNIVQALVVALSIVAEGWWLHVMQPVQKKAAMRCNGKPHPQLLQNHVTVRVHA